MPKGDQDGIDALEKQLLAQNAEHKDWACTEEMMKLTKDGKALYLHCLPADITGLSCPEGEVDNSVFDRYLVPLYKQASYKPYIIAAMIFLRTGQGPRPRSDGAGRSPTTSARCSKIPRTTERAVLRPSSAASLRKAVKYRSREMSRSLVQHCHT